MANKKAEIRSKKRSIYLHENLFEEFSSIAKENGKSASYYLNGYMKRAVEEYKRKKTEGLTSKAQ